MQAGERAMIPQTKKAEQGRQRKAVQATQGGAAGKHALSQH
jgi:hypothetical protein